MFETCRWRQHAIPDIARKGESWNDQNQLWIIPIRFACLQAFAF